MILKQYITNSLNNTTIHDLHPDFLKFNVIQKRKITDVAL